MIRACRKTALIGLLTCLPQLGLATVNEALSIAFEAATPYVEDGYEVRQDNWSGDLKISEPKLVKHQLFRGNEYWFWAGTSFPGCSIAIEIYDSTGHAVSLESFADEGKAGVRVLPAKTGTYYILVKVEMGNPVEGREDKGSSGDVVDWALVYGYR